MNNKFELSNKNLKRLQKKKQKLESYFQIAVLNDTDREANRKKQEEKEGPPKKKRKTNIHGRDKYKQEIAEMMEKQKQESKKEEKKELSDKDYQKLKALLRERKKLYKTQPRFWIRENGLKASLNLPSADRIPLFLGDIQHLILFATLGNKIHQQHNRWCHLERHGLVSQVVLVMLEGIGSGDLLQPIQQKSGSQGEEYRNLSKFFPDSVELVNPASYDRNVIEDIALVPLTPNMLRKILLKYGSKEAELKSRVFSAAFPITLKIRDSVKSEEEANEETDETKSKKKSKKEENKQNKATDKTKTKKKSKKKENEESEKEVVVVEKVEIPCLHPNDKFSRVELLLSPSQMISEGYPLPIGQLAYQFLHYVYTKDHYAPVSPLSPMFGLDCEMCFTSIRKNELTRVSIVDENHKVVYESLVMPKNRIINYLTQYSGITPQMMRGVKTTLADVQRDIRNLLPPDAILVGQSLNFDLHALELFHPYVIDSSVVFNIWGQRKHKTKLKTLAEMFLGMKIQTAGMKGHDSIEDSIASLKLVQLKLSKYIEFGDSVLGFSEDKKEEVHEDIKVIEERKQHVIEIEERLKEEGEEYKHLPTEIYEPDVVKVMEATSLFKLVAKTNRLGVFGTADTIEEYKKYLNIHANMSNIALDRRNGTYTLEANSNYKVVSKFVKEANVLDFAVVHLKLNAKIEKHRIRAVNTCIKVCENVKENGLVVVVTGGRPKEESDGSPAHRPGCFIHLKLPTFTKL